MNNTSVFHGGGGGNALYQSINHAYKTITRDDKILIWGRGLFIEETVKYLRMMAKVVLIVDVDSSLHGVYAADGGEIPIEGPDAIRRFDITKAVISVTGSERFMVFRQIMKEGLGEDDIFFANQLIPFLAWRLEKRIVIPTVDLFVNTICSLNCIGCIAGVSGARKNRGYVKSLPDVKSDLEAIFEKVDFVKQLSLSTGDIFLHPELHRILDEIYRFKDRFGRVTIVVNGVTHPDENAAEALAKYKFSILISDYSQNTDRCRIERLMTFLNEYGIECKVPRHLQGSVRDGENMWSDIGDTCIPHNRDDVIHNEIFSKCSNRTCEVVHNGRLYGCGVAVWRDMFGLYQCTTNDFCELSDTKEAILRFYLGMTERGYYDVCTHCDGVGPEVNTRSIPAGVQITSNS